MNCAGDSAGDSGQRAQIVLQWSFFESLYGSMWMFLHLHMQNAFAMSNISILLPQIDLNLNVNFRIGNMWEAVVNI